MKKLNKNIISGICFFAVVIVSGIAALTHIIFSLKDDGFHAFLRQFSII